MLTKLDLIEKVKSYDTDADIKLLDFACEFSKKSHGEQKRASGDPYYYHPLAVANILADMKLDVKTIITALLHDTVEDTDVTLAEIEEYFGKEVRNLVDGVTKLTKIEYQSEQTRQAENFRKLLLAISEDIRVLIVKLADRLHNMRTLHFVKSPLKRQRIAHETMEIYAPLAERIGMQYFKTELQDLAFAEIHPEVRESIVSRLEYLRKEGKSNVNLIIEELTNLLQKEAPGVKLSISGREKTPCSIWIKMKRKNINFEQLSDIMAFRIITENVDDCYKILGIIHVNYKCIPESFNDFISIPKNNGYQSLHTVVLGPTNNLIEVQIRTKQMHDIAEYGVAAHWSYKQNFEVNTEERQYKWLREMLSIIECSTDPDELLENSKLEMYYDQVFCFTPRGDLIALPKGATSVDFAYSVHSKVGNHCCGAKINGRIVPLRTKLQNGDQVEIITSENHYPTPNWEHFVVTGKAKSEIRRFVRSQRRQEYINLGQSLVRSIIKDNNIKLSQRKLKDAMIRLGRKTLDDLYSELGEGVISDEEFLKAVDPGIKSNGKKLNPLSLFSFNKRFNKKYKSESLPIEGLIPGVAVNLAECCCPIPGDSIVGVKTLGKGIIVHTSDCENLSHHINNPENLIDLHWGRADEHFTCKIKLVLKNQPGSLAEILNIIAENNSNISNLKVLKRASDFFEIQLDLDVRGDTHLDNVITAIRSSNMVHSVDRKKI